MLLILFEALAKNGSFGFAKGQLVCWDKTKRAIRAAG